MSSGMSASSMRLPTTFAAAALLVALAACSDGDTPVESLTVVCPAMPPFLAAPMTLEFSDTDGKVLKVTGGFGDVSLPASYILTEAKVDDETIRMKHIEARGTSTLAMPDRAAFDACVTGREKNPADKDAVAIAAGVCARELPVDGAVPVEVDIAMIVMDGADIDVSFNRSYSSPPAPKLEIFPPLVCKVQ